MFALFAKNIIFVVLSFGLYIPWAKTNFRRYVWSHTLLSGDRFAYTGQARDIFWGWVKLLLALLGATLALLALKFFLLTIMPLRGTSTVISSLTSFAYAVVFAMGILGGYRYLIVHTQWRQVRLGFEKEPHLTSEFIALYLTGIALCVITLGFYIPFFRNSVRKFLIDRSYLGQTRLLYTGTGWGYFRVFSKNLFLVFVTFGFYYPWFQRNTLKYRLENVNIEDAHFSLNITGSQLFYFTLVSFIAVPLTLGLAIPWLLHWRYRIFINGTSLVGPVDLEAILQGKANEAESGLGDAAASAFDAGFDL